MPMYIRYDGLKALKWTDQHSDAEWWVWLYERSTQMIVLHCRFGEHYNKLGFLVLRGVQAVDMTATIGAATLALINSGPEHTDLTSEQSSAMEMTQILRIAGDDQNTDIAFHSFSAYELMDRIEENL